MPRYIDADNIQYHWLPLSAMPDKFVTAEDIEQMPTADVAEVVRCRDCVYRSIYPNSDKQYWCNQWNTKVVYENGYCYRGKTDETD